VAEGVPAAEDAAVAFLGLRPRFAPVPRAPGAPPLDGTPGFVGMNVRSGAGYVAKGGPLIVVIPGKVINRQACF